MPGTECLIGVCDYDIIQKAKDLYNLKESQGMYDIIQKLLGLYLCSWPRVPKTLGVSCVLRDRSVSCYS